MFGSTQTYLDKLGIQVDVLSYLIVGGLIFSQVLTLYTTPVVYLYLDRLRLWNQRRKHQRVDAHGQPAVSH